GDMIVAIQRDLFALGARLADPAHRIAPRVTKVIVDEASVQRLEQWIDALDASLPPSRHCVLPGGSPAGAGLRLPRTVCRRAERAGLRLDTDAVEPVALVYLSRLSDLLFVMARAANHRSGVSEIEW